MAQRVRRADVGLARASAHSKSNAGTGEIDAAAGKHAILRDEIIDCVNGEDGDITIGAVQDIPGNCYGRAPRYRQFLPAAAFKGGDDIEHHRFDAVGAENLHVAIPPGIGAPPMIIRRPSRIDVRRVQLPISTA